MSIYRRTLAYASLHYYRFFSKRICFAHGICEFTPIFDKQEYEVKQFENALRHESRYLPITRALSLRTFILQSGELSRAETISQMHSAVRRVTGLECRQLLQVERQLLTRPTRGNRIRSIATSTISIDCSHLSSTKRCSDRD